MDVKGLNSVADDLFGKKMPLNSLHQEISENFYPERADFTITRSLGDDFASNLMSSYPVQCRRQLGNSFSSMLRPTAKPWFHVKRRHVENEDTEVKTWLRWFEETQRRAMYYQNAMFNRATKEGDHDFAAFGQCCLSVEFHIDNDGRSQLLYRAWHLRDMAWQEDEIGQVGFVCRKWKPTAMTLRAMFKDKLHPKVTKLAQGATPFETVNIRHFVVPAQMYDGSAGGRKRWSIWYDVENDHLIEAVPIWGRHYIIPRWQTVSGSQYSYSPATVCGLPDARLLQAMTFTLLEAGEKATNPPMVAVQNAVRTDLAVYAGGVTWVDNEYDERLGEALRPIAQDFRGFNFGVEMNQDTRSMLSNAFFLNVLTLPQRTAEMTAYEVAQRVQEYIRDALPLFEPMEDDYNGQLCEETFGIMLHRGGFGDPRGWPKQLRGADIDFAFESPLHDQIEEQKGQKFTNGLALIGQAIALDPACAFIPKATEALRDALLATGTPPTWLNSEAYVDQMKANQAAQAAAQQRLASIATAAGAANDIGNSGLVPTATAA